MKVGEIWVPKISEFIPEKDDILNMVRIKKLEYNAKLNNLLFLANPDYDGGLFVWYVWMKTDGDVLDEDCGEDRENFLRDFKPYKR